MKKVALLTVLVLISILLPTASAMIEEDWSKYTRIDETKRDASGNNVTLSWSKRSYTNENENYTVTVDDFDAQGIVVLDVRYKDRTEKVLLRGEWDASRTRIITDSVEAFNKTMTITLNKIIPPSGVFTCCPEAEVNIDLIRPELYLEFKEDTIKNSLSYLLINPFANWTSNPYTSPYDSSYENETIDTEEKTNSYHMYEEIPIEINVSNQGDAESTKTEVFIDTDGLKFEYGYPYYQLTTMAGLNQKNFIGQTEEYLRLKLKFPSPPTKLNYTVHAYVKGVKGDTTYYYDDTKEITLLPSIGIRKSVTKESMLLSRKDIEGIYPSLNSDEISRWLQAGDTIVTLGVTNYQNYAIKGIKLYDALNKQFTTENASLNWTFDLKPSESKEFKYKLVGMRPGDFKLPPAQVTYSELNMSWKLLSNTPDTQIHGSCIQVFKKTEPVLIRGQNATVTLTIRNTGDMPSKVKVTDTLPEKSTFLGGSMYYEGVMLPRGSAQVSYVILMEGEGQVQLPNPEVYVNGKENNCGQPISSKVLIKEPPVPTPAKTVQVPVETPIQTQIPRPQQNTWLEGLIPAIMLVLAVIVLLMLHRS